jgi:hypothetical protein
MSSLGLELNELNSETRSVCGIVAGGSPANLLRLEDSISTGIATVNTGGGSSDQYTPRVNNKNLGLWIHDKVTRTVKIEPLKGFVKELAIKLDAGQCSISTSPDAIQSVTKNDSHQCNVFDFCWMHNHSSPKMTLIFS